MCLWPFQIKGSVRHQKPVCSKTKVSLQRLQTQNCVTVSWASWSRLPPIAKSMTCSRIQSVEEQGDPEPCLFYFVVIISWEISSYIRLFSSWEEGVRKHTQTSKTRHMSSKGAHWSFLRSLRRQSHSCIFMSSILLQEMKPVAPLVLSGEFSGFVIHSETKTHASYFSESGNCWWGQFACPFLTTSVICPFLFLSVNIWEVCYYLPGLWEVTVAQNLMSYT